MVRRLCEGGELFKRLLSKGKYSERDASRVMRQILSAVADCHVHGIIHRDLKPENFLYLNNDDDALLKVTDFGLSEFFSLQSQKPFNDIAGSAFYVAPEVLRRKYGPAADLWSCGVIMYILLTGEARRRLPVANLFVRPAQLRQCEVQMRRPRPARRRTVAKQPPRWHHAAHSACRCHSGARRRPRSSSRCSVASSTSRATRAASSRASRRSSCSRCSTATRACAPLALACGEERGCIPLCARQALAADLHFHGLLGVTVRQVADSAGSLLNARCLACRRASARQRR
jgi:serine/threonine protein kinase